MRLDRVISALIPSPTADTFRAFSNRISEPAVIAQLAADSGWQPDVLAGRVSTALGEVAQTLAVLAGIEVPPGARVLEVGAGLGLTSAYLSTCGFQTTALEPAGLGFQEHATLASSVASVVGSAHALLPIGAADLERSVHGTFDLVFSNNVLEHIADPEAALAAMRAVLEPDGLMVHSCPNYSVPFEPHFGVPLLPIRPSWTSRLLPSSIGSSDLWKSLNFVTASQVRCWADDLGLDAHFRAGSLVSSIERLGTDEEFRTRHRALAVVGRVLVTLRVTRLLRRLPASWATPMLFALSVRGSDPTRVRSWLAGADECSINPSRPEAKRGNASTEHRWVSPETSRRRRRRPVDPSAAQPE